MSGKSLGIDNQELSLGSAAEFASVVGELAAQCRLSLKIFTHQLDEKIFDNPAFIESIARLANRSRYTGVMILLRDPLPALQSGHRIVAASQRFSSGIHVRRVSEDHSGRTDEYVIADDLGLAWRTSHERYQGIANFLDRDRLPELLADFKDLWEFATPETQFRRLHI